VISVIETVAEKLVDDWSVENDPEMTPYRKSPIKDPTNV